MSLFGKPKCIHPEADRWGMGCSDPKCPERIAFWALMDGSVDPLLGQDMPIRFEGTQLIEQTLNINTPNDNNGLGVIKARSKFDRLNRRARGRFVIVWDVEPDIERQSREYRPWVTHMLLQNFVVRGEPTVKDMTRIKRIAEKNLKVTGLFVSVMQPLHKKSTSDLARSAGAR